MQGMEKSSIFSWVDKLITDQELRTWGEHDKISERRGEALHWTQIPPLEEKVWVWSKEYPVIWNVGIGPTASFVRTLTRLLFERMNYIYGPYDHIIRMRFPPTVAADNIIAQRWLAVEALMEIAGSLQLPHIHDKLLKLKQLAAEESYYGYGTITENLMLEAFGQNYYAYRFVSDLSIQLDPIFDLQPDKSPVLESVMAAPQEKRYLMLVENLQVPVSLDVLAYLLGKRPSLFQLNSWLISTTSKDVCEESRKQAARSQLTYWFQITQRCYHAPPFDDLSVQDSVMLIKEALRDAAGSIRNALQQQQDDLFWLFVSQHCLYYAILYHTSPGAAGHQASTTTISYSSVTSDELVRCWVAEDLLFSLTSPTNIPETTSKKQSNYRSAYETGKIVIQALQEYSLLPIYYVSTPTSSTSSTASSSASIPKDAVTGLSQLEVGVPRIKQDELFDQDKSSRLRWLSFMNDDGRHVSWDWRSDWDHFVQKAKFIHGEITMSTLILRGCSNISTFPFDKILNHYLRVLDLSYTPINSLPHWFSRLLNLHLLSLRGCSLLETLSPPPLASEEEYPPLAHLGKLQVLDMNGVPLVELTQQDGSNKSNLHYLDLSGSRVTTLPSKFFHEMTTLEELILGNCSLLKELPPSLAELSNLLVLHVEGTQIACFPEDTFESMQRLHTLKLINNMLIMSLPSSLSKANSLKELHIYNCIALKVQFLWELVSFLEDLYIKAWEGLEDIKINGHPNMRTFSLSGPWIRYLSLHGCSKLKIVNFSDDLTALEDVDLSGTAIEEVPHNLPNLPHLRMLLLLNVPCFQRFPWHQLVRFPMVFYLDHCVHEDNQFSKVLGQQEILAAENRQREQTTNTAQIKIDDSRMFHSFNKDAAWKLVEHGQFLRSFSVQVKPCRVRGRMEPRIEDGELCTEIQKQAPYLEISCSVANSIMHMMNLQPRQCHVEISATNRYPNGLRHLLSVTNSLFINDDDFVECLTDLDYRLMSLEECQLQNCHQMTVVLRMTSKGSEVLPSLKILQVSNLKNLLSFVEFHYSRYQHSNIITLKLLKHIHLEHCPRLEKIFPCTLSLPMLESLVILFCPNLKTIFYKQDKFEVTPSPLPKIENIYLQELPQFQHIHEDVMFRSEMPRWEKLFVRGCPSFRRLPLLEKEYLKSKVKVSGERDWYDKLQLTLPEQHDYYLHVPPPEFASRKKSVIIRSYLR